MSRNIHTKRFLVELLVVVIALIPLFIPILSKGFWVTDDGEWMLIRLSAFYREIRSGQFPVRFLGHLNHEYGYPVSNFLYPGFLYAGSFFMALGVGVVNSIKLVLITASVVFTGSLYLWLKKFSPPLFAFVGSIIGVYSPYYLFDLFERGSIGEIWALASVPLFLYSVESNYFFLACISIAWLLLSHNGLAVIFLPFLIIYTVLRRKIFLTTIVFGLGLSSFFWLPALFELRYVIFQTVEVANWQRYFLTLANFRLLHLWGVVMLVMTIGANHFMNNKRLVWFMSLAILTSVWLTSPFSQIIWQSMPIGRIIQFPWRFLAVLCIGYPFIAAVFLQTMKKWWQRGIISIVTITLILNVWSFFPRERINKGDEFYWTNDDTTTVKNEYLPIWVRSKPANRPKQKIDSEYGYANVIVNVYKPSMIDLTVESSFPDVLDIHKIYYPGWVLKREMTYGGSFRVTEGYVKIPVLPGKDRIRLSFRETPERYLADSVSIATLVILLWNGVLRKKAKI